MIRNRKNNTELSLQMSAQKLLEWKETSSFNSHKPTHSLTQFPHTAPREGIGVLLQQRQSGFTPKSDRSGFTSAPKVQATHLVRGEETRVRKGPEVE